MQLWSMTAYLSHKPEVTVDTTMSLCRLATAQAAKRRGGDSCRSVAAGLANDRNEGFQTVQLNVIISLELRSVDVLLTV